MVTYYILIVFNLPGVTFGVGITILPYKDWVIVDDMLTGKVVLLVRDVRVSTFFSTLI